jgi:hypothetical protein
MYKLTKTNNIIRLADNVLIPMDTKNFDYREYLYWVSQGNTPIPVDPPSQEELDEQNRKQLITQEQSKVHALPTIQFLKSHTAEEIEDWIQTNVTTLAKAKDILAKLAIAVGVSLR